jgi:hypothetical protein
MCLITILEAAEMLTKYNIPTYFTTRLRILILHKKVNGKVELVFNHQMMKGYVRMEVWLHAFLTLEMSGRLHIPTGLPQWKNSWYPLNRSLGKPRSQFGCSGFFSFFWS